MAGRCLAVELVERHQRPPDIAGGRVGEQPGLEHHGGQSQGGILRVCVEARHGEQIPEGVDGTRGLAVCRQPRPEGLLVERGVGEVEPAQGQRAAYDAQPVGQRKG